MSTVFDAKPQAAQNLADISSKLEFQKQLQSVTNRIHATSNVDEIMLELGQDICSLLGADRLTVYALSRRPLVDRIQGENWAHLVQGSQAADQRPEHCRLRRTEPQHD